MPVGGIQVDRNYQTNLSDIYAVGDAILVKQELTGQESLISLASPANRQGRQVADIIAGLDHRRNRGSIGTFIVRVFELTAAATGLTEKLARESFDQLGMVHTISQDHVSYYPGASPIRLKLIYNKVDGKILGAQAVGKKGVDKRIDVIATAIKGGLTVADLPELELAYAPPFGSAKDPVNIAGYVALNELEGLSETIQWYEVADYMEGGAVMIPAILKSWLEDSWPMTKSCTFL